MLQSKRNFLLRTLLLQFAFLCPQLMLSEILVSILHSPFQRLRDLLLAQLHMYYRNEVCQTYSKEIILVKDVSHSHLDTREAFLDTCPMTPNLHSSNLPPDDANSMNTNTLTGSHSSMRSYS